MCLRPATETMRPSFAHGYARGMNLPGAALNSSSARGGLGMQERLRFGRFEVRPKERVLLVDGRAAKLGSRAFDLLVALVERRDRLVSKEELLEVVWLGRVVEENNLAVHLSALRKLIGAQAIK